MNMRKFFIIAVVAWGLFMATGVGAYWWWQKQVNEPLVIDQQVLYELKSGAGTLRLLNDLIQKGYVAASPLALEIHLRTGLKGKALKAGHYWLTSEMTFDDVVEIMVQGKQATFSFSIIAGHTFSQIKQALAQADWVNFDLDNDAVLTELLGQWHTLMKTANVNLPVIDSAKMPPSKLLIQEGATQQQIILEGAFLAETYFYHVNDRASAILERAMHALASELNQQWSSYSSGDTELKTSYEALILASIIEKETGLAEERGLISGVFHNRLAKGMRLQTDPTVIYGLGDQFDGNLTRKHLRTPTLYNTYVIKGLPPTPIAMVGREAIHAAVLPQDTSAFYFVAKGDGSHQFSETLQQHNDAVYRYQINKESQD